MPNITSSNAIRQRNRARVMDALIQDGPATRMQLAEVCRMSPASAANMVQDLLSAGLVAEGSLISTGNGRPSTQVEVKSEAASFIGVDVGESEMTLALYDLTLTRRDVLHVELAPPAASPQAIAEALCDGVSTLAERNPGRLAGVGLALPGIVEAGGANGPVLYAQNIGWDPTPISHLFESSEHPVVADNGAKAYARAERRRGAIGMQEDAEAAVVVLLGRGVGMGILDRGRIMRGLSSSAGEFGHMKIAATGPQCACGSAGCVESFVGADAIIRRWRELGATTSGNAHTDIRALVGLAGSDPVADQVLDETVEHLTLGLSNVVNLLNPGQCVIGGWVGVELMSVRARQISERTKARSLRHPAEQVRIHGTALGTEAIALGAALMALETFLEYLSPISPAEPAQV